MSEFVLAESGIRQLHARYVDAVWRKDFDAFIECFAEEGEWKIAGMHMRGRPEIRGTATRLLGACERVLLTHGNPLLEVGDGRANGRLHCLEFAKLVDGTSAMTIGIYHDRYLEQAGRWRFAWRHWALQYRGSADLSAAFFNGPDYGPFPGMPRPDEPTIVRRAC